MHKYNCTNSDNSMHIENVFGAYEIQLKPVKDLDPNAFALIRLVHWKKLHF